MATKPQKLKNLLFFGDFGCTTGFANVSKELIENWAKDKNLKIVVFAINDYGKEPYDYLPNVKVIPAMSSVLADEPKDDVYCRLQFLRLLMHNDFDVVFCLNDIEIFNEMGEHLRNVKNEKRKQNKPSFKSMVYFPIDSEPRPVDLKILDFFEEAITYTEYAKSVLTPLTTPSNAKKIKVIPHGCNTKEFYPLSEEEKLKAKLEIVGEGNEETFLFGTVNRNSARKDLGSLVLGFSTFKRNSEANAVLYLHCNPLDPSGINIHRLCERLGLRVGVDIIFPKSHSENKGCDNAELNRIYNALDCFVTTTTAEGWGLTVTEAMATKTLVVCPQHTSLTEITEAGNNTISFMFNQANVFVNDFEKIRFTTNPHEVTNLLGIVYNLKHDEEEVQIIAQEKVERAYEKVKGLKWENVAKEFKLKIDKLAK
jgi:glycosyltransferase involved in cell wall biosynthesis